ncbi:hypothetical protein FPV67DRAFT_292721 [Lyophyllum atratum]|nr:hypothetical protein FPV67DRAFT_292721 [Lyophyllum atratum]
MSHRRCTRDVSRCTLNIRLHLFIPPPIPPLPMHIHTYTHHPIRNELSPPHILKLAGRETRGHPPPCSSRIPRNEGKIYGSVREHRDINHKSYTSFSPWTRTRTQAQKGRSILGSQRLQLQFGRVAPRDEQASPSTVHCLPSTPLSPFTTPPPNHSNNPAPSRLVPIRTPSVAHTRTRHTYGGPSNVGAKRSQPTQSLLAQW